MAEKNHRLCISCRQTAHRDTLWRVVRTFPDHQVQLDRGVGRSAYLCPRADCLEAAQKKNRLSRMLRAKVPPEIYHALSQRLDESYRQGSSGSAETASAKVVRISNS